MQFRGILDPKTAGSAYLAVALLWGSCGTALAAAPAHWKDTGFSINADGKTLGEVLTSFGATYGVQVALDMPAATIVKGRLQGANGTEFLDRLAVNHQFRWFVYHEKLYVVPLSDFSSVRLEIGEDALPDAKAALTGIGLFDQRFGWGELQDEGVVMVSGPRAYVELVKSVLLPDGKKPDKEERSLMLFRLKYASAVDREIQARGRTQVVPGVKSILTSLLESMGLAKSGKNRISIGSTKPSRTGKQEPGEAREIGLIGRLGIDGRSESANTSSSREQQGRSAGSSETYESRRRDKDKETEKPIRVEADPSLNAIIIYDLRSRRAMYQALLDEIDIQPQQIEIEALIVDIERSKLSELGAEWGLAAGDNFSVMFNGTAADSQGADLPLPGSTLLIRSASKFYARLHAMEGRGDARVLAKPTVLTLDNVGATLDLSQSRYLQLVGERVADLADISAGTMLKVVPRIIREGGSTRVRLDIDIEDGTVAPQTTGQSTEVTRSVIATQAMVEPNHTLLIGGYHSEAKTSSLKKIPLLSDIPYIGRLFQNHSDSVSNRERLFLITPRIVGNGSVAAPPRSHAGTEAEKLLLLQSEGVERPDNNSAALAEPGVSEPIPLRAVTGLASRPR